MTSLVDLYPPFGLHVVAGPLELRGLTDELLLELCDARRGRDPRPRRDAVLLPVVDRARRRSSAATPRRTTGASARRSPPTTSASTSRCCSTARSSAARASRRSTSRSPGPARPARGSAASTRAAGSAPRCAGRSASSSSTTSASRRSPPRRFLDNPASLGGLAQGRLPPRPGRPGSSGARASWRSHQGLVLTPGDVRAGRRAVEVTGADAVRALHRALRPARVLIGGARRPSGRISPRVLRARTLSSERRSAHRVTGPGDPTWRGSLTHDNS